MTQEHTNSQRRHHDPAAYQLAYEEGRRALEDQQSSVTEIRSRAGQLVAAAAITTSFFGAHAITGTHLHATTWVAVICFIALSFFVLKILWPRGNWEFDVSPGKLIAGYVEPPGKKPFDLAEIHRNVALHMDASIESNRERLSSAVGDFRLATIFLGGEVVSWVVGLLIHR